MSFVKKYFSFLALLLLGIAIGVAATLLFQYFKGPKQTVNISGQGTIEAQADQAIIDATVENTSWSQEQAQADNKKDAQDLKDKLLKLGIPESRINESSFDNSPVPVPMVYDQSVPGSAMPSRGNSSNTVTYDTSFTITVDTLTGLDKIFTVINDSAHAKVSGTNYSLKNSTVFDAKAKEKALEDARSQAETIAKVNKLRVGKLLSITDNNNQVFLNKEAMAAGGSPVPAMNVSYGEKTIPITASFTAVYELY